MRRKPDYPARVRDLPPAPGDLEVVKAFVNTADFEHGTDELSSKQALARWLERWVPGHAPERLSPADVEQAAEVREALRELIAANLGDAVSDDAVARLDRAAASAASRVRFERGGGHRREGGPGALAGGLGLLFAIVAAARDQGLWPRLKACSNPACRAVFWDASTNRSAVWCSMRRCGNRIASRRSQKRKRRGAGRGAKRRIQLQRDVERQLLEHLSAAQAETEPAGDVGGLPRAEVD